MHYVADSITLKITTAIRSCMTSSLFLIRRIGLLLALLHLICGLSSSDSYIIVTLWLYVFPFWHRFSSQSRQINLNWVSSVQSVRAPLLMIFKNVFALLVLLPVYTQASWLWTSIMILNCRRDSKISTWFWAVFPHDSEFFTLFWFFTWFWTVIVILNCLLIRAFRTKHILRLQSTDNKLQ